MYTTCPHCRIEFHISAAQLQIAAGKVRCGNCAKLFSAIRRLHDAPRFLSEGSKAGEPVKKIKSKQSKVEASKASNLAPEERTESTRSEVFDEQYGDWDPFDEPLETSVNRGAKIFWTIGVVSMVLLGVLQLFWFNRDLVHQRYPELIPYTRIFCEFIECHFIRHQDPAAIQLVSRDVRAHPKLPNVLLVNVTLVNSLATIQTYPIIQIALFDVGGKIVGERKFKPKQYLDQSIPIYLGMQPNSPVHIVLEIAGQIDNAESFEFRFL